jgi:putative drug exporter of the RND superfamily
LLPVVALPSDETVRSPGVRADLRRLDARLRRALPGARIASYASTGDSAFVGADGRTVFALVYPRPAASSEFGENPTGLAAGILLDATVIRP